MRRKRIELPFRSRPTYQYAKGAITDLENNVIAQMVSINYTAEDVVNCLWPSQVTDALIRAFQMCADKGKFQSVQGDENLLPFEGTIEALSLDVQKLGMLRPEAGYISVQTDHPRWPLVLQSLKKMRAIIDEFNVLRRIVEWAEVEHVTAGAMRYYFPSMCILLKNDHTHAIHDANGTRYGVEPIGIGEMTKLFREGSGTVASAMLCPKRPESMMPLVTVKFPQPGALDDQWKTLIRQPAAHYRA